MAFGASRIWPRRRPIRVALFVDFDNVAPSVGTFELVDRVDRWTLWMERGAYQENDGRRRIFVIKNCYWNTPAERYRGAFEAAGFSVISTPSRTRTPKSAADISIAIDCIDALTRSERIDEFIILSSDSDFTPLAERLRAAGKIVTVFADTHAVPAYLDVADNVIASADLFRAARAPDPPKKRGFLSAWARFFGCGHDPADEFDIDALATHFLQDLKSRRAPVMGVGALRRKCAALEGFEIEGPKAWFGHGEMSTFCRRMVEVNAELDLHIISENDDRVTIRLAPGVLEARPQRASRRRSEAPAADLDVAAAKLAEAARVTQTRTIGKRGVRRALTAMPGFGANPGPQWLGLRRYHDMLKGLAERRADISVLEVSGGGLVLKWEPSDAETDAALDRALKFIETAPKPLRVDDFFASLSAIGAKGEPGLELDERGRRRLLKRLVLAGLDVDFSVDPALISDPHGALEPEPPRLPAPSIVSDSNDPDDPGDHPRPPGGARPRGDKPAQASQGWFSRGRAARRGHRRAEASAKKKRRLSLFGGKRRS